MKKTLIFAAAIGAFSTAHAQSAVTLYGTIDAGVTYINSQQKAGPGGNVPGITRSPFRMGAGMGNTSVWGLRGSEDLGNGIKAIFKLESGFNVASGQLQERGTLFNRTAMVGLSSDLYGTLMLGRQYDAHTEFLSPFAFSNQLGGRYSANFGDWNNLNRTFSIANAVNYHSPVIAGFQLGATYSMTGMRGRDRPDNSYAVALRYSMNTFSAALGMARVGDPYRTAYGVTGPGTYRGALPSSDGVGYTAMQNSTRLNLNTAALSYGIGPATVGLVASLGGYTRSAYPLLSGSTNGNPITFGTIEVNGRYQITPAISAGAAYSYTDIRSGKSNTAGLRAKFHQVSLGSQYSLSKRTALYLNGTYQKAAGTPSAAGAAQTPVRLAQLPGLPPSARDSQFAVTVGVRHSF